MTDETKRGRIPFRAILAPFASLLAGSPPARAPVSAPGDVFEKLLQLADAEDRLLGQRDTLARVAGDATVARKAAQAASDAKSGFLADMSHELRTPLNAIIGITELMLEDARDGNLTNFLEPLERVSNAGQHLLRLINDFLDLSKIEAGKMQLTPERIDVSATLQEIVIAATPLAEKNKSRLTLDCAASVGFVYADPLRLKQILLNLIGNACKFTKDGNVRVTSRRDDAPAGSHLVVAVSDDGIGMTAEQMGRLFQEYSQADAQTAREYGGTGLGLVISRRLALIMGGNIDAVSEPGVGSTFILRLPMRDTAASVPGISLETGIHR